MRKARYALVAGLFLASGVSAKATTQTWTGTSGTDWGTAADWNSGSGPVPASGDTALFNTGSGTSITVANAIANQAVTNISFDTAAANFTIGTVGGDQLQLQSGGTTQILSTLTATNAIETINAPIVLEGANGTYTFSNNSANGAGAGAGTLNFGGAISGGASGTTVLTLSGTNTNANTISGVISDGSATHVAVTANGTGQWVLSGLNTYSGGTTISTGTLAISGTGTGSNNSANTSSDVVTNGPLGTGTLTLSGGTLTTSGTANVTMYNNIAASASTSSTIYANFGSGDATLFLDGNLSGSGNIMQTGPSSNNSTVELNGNDSLYTGTYTESGSGGSEILEFNNANAGSASAAWVIGSSSRTGEVQISNANGSTIYFGSLAGAGGGGTFRSDSVGTTTISVGALGATTTMANPIVINGTDNIALVLTGGNLTLSAANTYTGGTFVQNGATLNLGRTTIDGTATILGTLMINSGGTVILSQNNVLGYNSGVSTGTVYINGGTLTSEGGGGYESQGFLTSFVMTAGTVNYSGATALNYAIDFSGSNGITTNASSTTATWSAPITLRDNTMSFQVALGSTSSGIDLNVSGAIGQSATFGLTKNGLGLGTLELTGANTYSGTTTINAGTIQVGNGTTGSLTSGALTFGGSGGTINFDEASTGSTQAMGALTTSAGGDTVQSTYGTSGTTSLTFSNVVARSAGATLNFVSSGGTNGTNNSIILTDFGGSATTAGQVLGTGYFYNGSNYAVVNSAGGYVRGFNYASDTGHATATGSNGITSSSTSNVELTGNVTAQNSAQVNTLNMGANTLALASGQTFQANGILVSGTAPSTYASSTISGGTGLETTTAGGELVINTNLSGDTLNISTPILNNSTSSLTATGLGTLTLSATGNAYAGATSVDSGTLSLSGTLTGGTAITVLAPAAFSETSMGGISGASSLTSYGTTTLAGTNNYTGQTYVNAGTTTISGSLGVTTAAGQINVGQAGSADSSLNATLDILPGATVMLGGSYMEIGNGTTYTTGVGAVYQSGGTVSSTGQLTLGTAASGYGYYNLSGGTLGVNEIDVGGFNGAGVGVFDMSGGTFNDANWLIASRGSSGGIGIINLTGGTLNENGNNEITFNWGTSQTSILNIANASLISNNGTDANINTTSSATNLGEVNLLSGGLFQVNEINASQTTGTSLVNFNGGTLQAVNANTTFLTTNLTGAYVYSGGGTINNNGVAITIPKALLAPTGSGVNSNPSVTSGGVGYTGAPAVTFTGGGGTGAEGYATVSGGVVTGIVITDPGTGYTTPPTIILTGGGYTTPAVIGNSSISADTSGGMTFTGGGTTTLSAAETYTGTTAVTAGTLSLASTGTLTGSNVTTSGTGVVSEVSGGVIAGSGTTFTQGSTGTSTLAGLNTYTGATKVNGGTLQITGNTAGTILSSSTPLTMGGGTFTLLGQTGAATNQTVASLSTSANSGSVITLNPNGATNANVTTLTITSPTLSTGAGSALNFNLAGGTTNATTPALGDTVVAWNPSLTGGIIGGGYTVTDAGGTGFATVSGGDVVRDTATFTALPTSGSSSTSNYGVNSIDGTSSTSAAGSLSEALSASESIYTVAVSTASYNTSDNLDLHGNTLTIANGGGILLTGANAYTIQSTVAGGKLTSGSGGAFVINNYGTGGLTISAPIVDNSGVAVTFAGTGTTYLTGANTYTGATGIGVGSTLYLNNGGTLGSATAASVNYAGNITDSGTFIPNNSSTSNQILSGNISGSGALTQLGSNTLTLSGSNTYSGVTTLSFGTLALVANGGNTSGGVTSALSNSSSELLLSANATLQLLGNTTNTIFEPANNYGNGGTNGYNGSASTTTGIFESGTGSPLYYIVAGSTNGATGNTLILGNFGQFGAGSTAPTFNFAVNNGYTLQIGSGAAGTGTLDTYNNTTINSNVAGGTLSIPGGIAINYNLSYTTTFGGAGNISVGALTQPTGTMYVTEAGPGTTTLIGANTYTGTTAVNGGTLQVGNGTSGSLASGTALVMGGGTFNLYGLTSGNTSQTVASLATTASTGSTITLTPHGTGITTLTITSTGTTTGAGSVLNFNLSGGTTNASTPALGNTVVAWNPTLTGGIIGGAYTVTDNGGTGYATVSSGDVIRWSDPGSDGLPASGGVSTGNYWVNSTYGTSSTTTAGSLSLQLSASEAANTVSVNTASYNSSDNLDLNGKTLTLTGNGGMLFTGANPYTIQTTAGGGNITSTSGGGIIFNNYNTNASGVTINVPILATGTNAVTFAGTGTTTLSSTGNTYTGATAIAGGTLNLSGTVTGGGAVTVYNGATLNLSGALTDTNGVTVNSGATLSESGGVISGAGALTSSGTTTLGGLNTYSGATTVSAGVLTVASGGAINNGNVTVPQLIVANTAFTNATLNITGGTVNATSGTAGTVEVGTANGAAGVINVSSGTLTTTGDGEIWLGDSGIAGQNPFGALIVSGTGSVTTGSWLALGRSTVANSTASGELIVTGGTLTVQTNYLTIGSDNNIIAVTDVATLSGGTTTIGTTNSAGGGIYVGQAQNGILNVSGTASVNILNTASSLFVGYNAGVFGIANFDGGTVTAGAFTVGSGTGLINFNGGTIQASKSSTTFMPAAAGLSDYVYSGGGTINNGGFNITVAQALLAPTGSGANSNPTVTTGGSGYIAPPIVTVSGAGGTGATAVATVSGGVVTAITITNPGTGYTGALSFTLTGGGGSGAVIANVTPTADSSGGFTFTSSGTGTTTLSSTNTYTGTTSITAGVLSLTGSLNGSNVTTSGSAVLSETSTGAITGSGTTLTQNSSGNSTLSGAGTNTYTGGTSITSGTLTLGATNALTNATGAINVNGGTFSLGSLTAAATVGGSVTLTSGTIAAGGTGSSLVATSYATQSGNITAVLGGGGIALTQSTTGTTTLTGANTYTGATTVSGGQLTVASGGSLASGSTVAVNNTATLAVNGTGSVAGAVSVNGGGTLIGTGTLSGLVTVAGGTTSTTEGTINLDNGVATDTLTLSSAGNTLTVGSATAGNFSNLDLEINGTSAADLLKISTGTLVVNAGGLDITVNPLGATGSHTYTLATFGAGSGSGFSTGTGTTVGDITLTDPSLEFGLSGTLTVSGTSIVLNTTGATAPTTAYWKGTYGSAWNSISGSNANFTSDAAGTTYINTYPASDTVVFGATGATYPGTITLGQPFSITGLNFLATDASSTTVPAINITDASNNLTLGTGGINDANTNGVTLAPNTLIVGGNQTWTNSSAAALLVSSLVNGAASTGTTTLALSNTSTGTTTISGAIGDGSSGGKLALSASTSSTGGIILTGVNTYSGITTISSGTLTIGGSGQLSSTATPGTYAGNIADTGTFLYNSSANDTLSGNITGTAGALTVSGSGTLTLSGTGNTYTGATSVSAGTLGLTGTLNGTSGVTTSGTGVVSETSGGVIAGSGTTFTQGSSGTSTLAGANTYAGLTTISNGVLSISANNNLGTSAVSLNGGTLQTTTAGTFNGNAYYTHAITVGSSGGTINVAGIGGAGTGQLWLTNTNLLLGSGALTITGNGTLTETGAGNLRAGSTNTYSGNMTLQSGGSLEYDVAGSVGASATFILGNNGDLIDSYGVTLPNNITVASSGGTLSTISFVNGNTGIFSGTVTLNAGLTVALANWYNNVLVNGTISGLISNGTNGAQGLTVTANNSGGSGNFTNGTTTGILYLTNSEAYTGGTTITSAVLSLGNGTTAGSLATTSAITFSNSNSYLAVDQTGTVNQNTAFNNNGSGLSGPGGFEQLGSGTTILNYANTFSGATNVNAGTLQYNGTSTMSANSALNLASGTTLNLYSNTSGTFTPGAVSGGVSTVNTTFNGSGTINVGPVTSGSNQAITLGGTTLINGTYTLTVANGGSGDSLTLPAVVTQGNSAVATFSPTSGTTLNIGTLTGNATYSTLNFAGAGTTNVTGAITQNAGSRSDALSFNQTGTVTISGSNDLRNNNNGSDGGTTPNGSNTFISVYSGTTDFNSNNAIYSDNANTFTINGGTIDNTSASAVTLAGGYSTYIYGNFNYGGTQNLTLNTNGVTLNLTPTITTAGTGTLTLPGVISGNAATYGLTAAGTGNLTLSGNNTFGSSGGVVTVTGGTLNLTGSNSYTGSTLVQGGTLNVGSTGSLTGSTTITVSNGAAMVVSGSLTAASPTITVNSGGAFTLNSGGSLASTTALLENGAANINTSTAISTLNGTNSGALLTLTSDTLTVSGGGSFAGVIQGSAGALTVTGGTLTLSGANTYRGATTVSAGTLQAGVASVAGVSGAFGLNSDVSLANVAGATLALNGYNTQIGSLTGGGTTGGTVSLGSNTLTIGGAASPAAFAGNITGASGNLVVNGGGVLTLSGTNSFGGTTAISNNSVIAYNGSGAIGTTSAISVASGSAAELVGIGTSGSTTDTLTLAGPGGNHGATGALDSVSGTNIFNDDISMSGATRISTDAGTLTLGGTITNGVAAQTTLTLAGASTGTSTINGVISNYSNTYKTSLATYSTLGGTWALAAANTFTGGTALNGGSLQLNNTNALQYSTVTVGVDNGNGTGSALTFNNAASGVTVTSSVGQYTLGALSDGGNGYALTLTDISGNKVNLTVGAGGGTGVTLNPSTTYAGILSGNGGITKVGTGTMFLTNTNSFTGGAAVNNGVLEADATGAFGTATATANSGGTLAFLAAITYNGALSLNGTGYNSLGALTINGDGGSPTAPSNDGSAVGSTTIFTGTVTVATSATLNSNGGTVDLNGNLVKNGTVATLTGGGTFDINGAISGASSGSDLVVNDVTTVQLNAANSYNGPTYVYGGSTLQTFAAGALPVPSAGEGSVLTLGNSGDTSGVTNTLDLEGTNQTLAALNSSNDANESNTVTNSGASTGTLTLTGKDGNATTQNGTFGGVIADGNSQTALTVTGGTQTLSGVNTYSGTTTVSGGTLIVSGSTASGSAVSINSGGTLGGAASSDKGTLNGSVTVASGGNINLTSGVIGTLSVGSLTSNGGTLTFEISGSTTNDAIASTGAFTIGSGTTTIDLANLLTNTSVNDGTYDLMTYSSTNAVANSTVVLSSSTFDTQFVTLAQVSGVLELIVSAPTVSNAYFNGTTTDMNTATNYDATASVGSSSGGAVTAATNVFFSANRNSNASATLSAPLEVNSVNFGAGTGKNSGITVSGSSTLQVDATSSNGNTAGNGISITGTGSDTISAPVALGGSQTWTSGSSTGSTLTVSGQVSGSYGLTTAGTGAVVLSNPTGNTYTGGTTVTSGVLYVDNTSNSGTGTGGVAVNGGRLAGNGIIQPGSGATSGVSVNSGGTLASGNITFITSQANTLTTGAGSGITLDNSLTDLGTNKVGDLNSSILSVDGTSSAATLTFALSTNTNESAGPNSFSNPSTNSTYMTVTGNTAGEISFAGTNDAVDLVDLTSGATLSLREGLPYLLISAGANSDYTGLVTSLNGTLNDLQLDGNGYVIGVGTLTDYSAITINQFGADGVTPLVANSTVYPDAQLYLENGNLEVVPEPGTWALMIGGLALLVFIQRRRNKLG